MPLPMFLFPGSYLRLGPDIQALYGIHILLVKAHRSVAVHLHLFLCPYSACNTKSAASAFYLKLPQCIYNAVYGPVSVYRRVGPSARIRKDISDNYKKTSNGSDIP